MIVLDLFCGLGGFSRAFREAGDQVIGIDIVPPADVVADVKAFPLRNFRPDVILASPPCTEFSKSDMPWHRAEAKPDTALYDAAKQVIKDLAPKWWVIENVRGAVPFFGAYTHKFGSRYLWTNIPLIHTDADCYGKWRLPPSPDRARLRSEIPLAISRAVRRAVCHDPRV